MDTEIARISEACGAIDFDDDGTWGTKPSESSVRRMRGCISVCDEVDGCNGANRREAAAAVAAVVTAVVVAAVPVP